MFGILGAACCKSNDGNDHFVLAACWKHKNLNVAAHGAERINELNPSKAGIPVLLTKMHA